MKNSFEGKAAVCFHSLLNLIENCHWKVIFWKFLIKESFTRGCALLESPSLRDKAAGSQTSRNAVTPGAVSPAFPPSLILSVFHRVADL